MDHPIWMLLPWAILSAAVGLKFWRFSRLVRRHLPSSESGLERARASLERRWQQDKDRQNA